MGTLKQNRTFKALLALLLLSVGLMQMACSKKKGGGESAPPEATPLPSGLGDHLHGCPSEGSVLLDQLTGTSPDGILQIEAKLSGTLSDFCYQPPEKKYLCGYGAGSLSGRIRVHGQQCVGLPPGDYSFCPQSPGQLISGYLSGGTYVMQGAGRKFELLLYQSVVTNAYSPSGTANGQVNGVFATFVVVNLPACTLTFSPL